MAREEQPEDSDSMAPLSPEDSFSALALAVVPVNMAGKSLPPDRRHVHQIEVMGMVATAAGSRRRGFGTATSELRISGLSSLYAGKSRWTRENGRGRLIG